MSLPEQNHQNTKICPKCGKEYPKNSIMCDDCNITLMKKTTYGRIMNDSNSTLLVCPKCQKRYYPPIKSDICENCNVDLISNSEYEHNQVKERQAKTTRSNIILATIFIIIGIAVIWFIRSVIISPSPDRKYTCARCDKTFTDSKNTKSIAYSNFCVKCHDDVEFLIEMSKALENL